jgi:hypothetical protein
MPTVKHVCSSREAPIKLLEYMSQDCRTMSGEAPDDDIIIFTGNAGTPFDDPKDVANRFESLRKEWKPYNKKFRRTYSHFVISHSCSDSQKFHVPVFKTHLFETIKRALPGCQWVASQHLNTFYDKNEKQNNEFENEAELIGNIHDHILVNSMKLDGSLLKTQFIQWKLRKASDEVARELGLSVPARNRNLAIRRESFIERNAKKSGGALIKTMLRDKLVELAQQYGHRGEFNLGEWNELVREKDIALLKADESLEEQQGSLQSSLTLRGSLVYHYAGQNCSASKMGKLFQLGGLYFLQTLGFEKAVNKIESSGFKMYELNRKVALQYTDAYNALNAVDYERPRKKTLRHRREIQNEPVSTTENKKNAGKI